METPNFKKFLNSSLVHPADYSPDESLILVTQEMFGSIFIDNLKASRAFFLYGESGSNGKSTLTNLMRDVIGPGFHSSLSLMDLSRVFGLSPLIGKKANIADELDDKFGSSKMFKQLVTGEPVGDQHKYGNHFTLYNRAKFIYSTNVLPTFDGLDGGLRRRVLIIPFYREFRDTDKDKDFNLADKLRGEIPGIIAWALEGAKRLMENGYRFTESKSITKMAEEFEDEASTPLRFFRDNYIVDETFKQFLPVQKLYEHYQMWMQLEGSKKVAGKRKFMRDITGVWRKAHTKAMRYRDDGEYIFGNPVTCINVYKKMDDGEIPTIDLENIKLG
jgi:putative DNA primase/helicase